MNLPGMLIATLLVLDYLVGALADVLNARAARPDIPVEFRQAYDAERYRRSQEYLRANTRVGLLGGAVMVMALLGIMSSGALDTLDQYVRALGFGPVLTGLLFCGVIFLCAQLLALPFALYRTFSIEERFGFNRTTSATFVLDQVKALLLVCMLGGPLLALVLWLFGAHGPAAWLLVWGVVAVFELLVTFIAPVLIMPLFNRFTPLPEGELRQAIERYAADQRFSISGIFTMDGSRRSAKANAFFTGFGRFRRIVLYDTLVAGYSVPELLAVLAHEMGHCRRGHIRSMLVISLCVTGGMLFLLSLTLAHPFLFNAFGVGQMSVHVGLVLFAVAYAPLGTVAAVVTNAFSRAHERAADRYVVESGLDPAALSAALRKLTVDNLGNLTPHPLKIALSYSHPPVLARMRALAAVAQAGIYKEV